MAKPTKAQRARIQQIAATLGPNEFWDDDELGIVDASDVAVPKPRPLPPAPSKPFLRADDIAAELGVGRSRAYEIIAQCERLVTGRTVRVSRASFEAWKRQHTAQPPDETRLAPAPRRRGAAKRPADPPSDFEAALRKPVRS